MKPMKRRDASLREKRISFTYLKHQLLAWFFEQDWSHYGKVELAEDEGTIHSPRRTLAHGEIRMLVDAVHTAGSFHHQGLATDLLIYIDGTYLQDGDHPIWRDINAKARSMDPQFGLGLRFGDADHLSLGEGAA